MGRDLFLERAVQWLNRRFAPPDLRIVPDTRLFASGLINSMRILELIAWTEAAIGRDIADAEIRMDNFQTARRMAEIFAALPEEATHVDG